MCIRDSFKLETEDDINHFKAEWDHETVYFFEKFVTSSEICTFDGLIDHDGNIVFSTTFDYAHTPLDLMIYKMDNSYYVLKDMDPKFCLLYTSKQVSTHVQLLCLFKQLAICFRYHS